MLTTAALGRAIVAGALMLAVAPSFAASGTTDIYLANVTLDVAYSADASKLAATNAQSAGIRDFAASTLRHERDVVAAIEGWRAKDETRVADLPMRTGRAVYDPTIDVDKFAQPDGTGVLMPPATVTIGQLSAMKGDTFDATYKAVQETALKRLAGFYEAYMRTGDDPSLRDMARGELAEVRAELAALD